MLRREQHHDPDDSHVHLRRLLDQRSARAPVAMEYDDTESLYSQFSPRPNAFLHETRSLHSYRAPAASPRPADRNRLNELAESMLDLDDDSRAPSDEDPDTDDAPDTLDPAIEPEDTRMSLLGPKMRFHGKAPWEMDGGVLEEEEEPESDRISNRGRDGIRKGLGFRSSSRGTTASSRPSGESGRSQAKPKRSFEAHPNSPYGLGGALHALGQASISSTSLVQPSRQPGLRLNFPLPRSDSPSSQYATPPRSPRSVTSPSNAPSPASRGNPHEHAHLSSNNKPLMRRATNDSAVSQSLYSEEMHPYANPDLVVSYAEEPSPASPARSVFNNAPSVSRSDSTTTVTESLATTTSRSMTGSTLTPDTSASSLSPSQSPRSRTSMFHGKEISAPLPIQPGASILDRNISSPIVAPALAGWTERSASPTFSLISLEQARAQRARSVTAQNLSISSTSSTPFPQVLTGDSHDQSPTNTIAARARARSISTGARTKTALHNVVGGMPTRPERRDSEPATVVQQGPSGGATGKTLKHKKSNGFMRLFNGARGTEKDEKNFPPPVPSLSDGYAAFNAQQQNGQKLTKVSSHRVPAPQISPSMVEAPNMWDDPNRVSPTSRPTPPSLSINTGPQSRLRATSAVNDFQTRTVPSNMIDREWQQTDLPQSAPPNVTEFPTLKLRPVSTLFSAHFGEHIVSQPDSDSQQPGLDADADTLSSTSPSTVVSPITPGMLLGRSSGDKLPMSTISEDQSALVQSLQEQIVTAKKAWQRHIWELEGQVRDLKAEVDGLRARDGEGYCDACGRGRPAAAINSGPASSHEHKPFPSVVNRPRARTGTSSRFGSAV